MNREMLMRWRLLLGEAGAAALGGAPSPSSATASSRSTGSTIAKPADPRARSRARAQPGELAT